MPLHDAGDAALFRAAIEASPSGIVVVDRWPLHPPKCCPGKKYEDRYMLMAGRLVDAK